MSLQGGGGGLQRYLQIILDGGLDVAFYQRRFLVSSNVRDVSVKVPDSAEDTANDRIKALFRGLRDLKKLKTVSFESTDENIPGAVPIQALTAAVTHSRHLKDLFIGNLIVRGSAQDLAALSGVLMRRQSLEEFALVGCRFAEATRAPALDPLVRGMADLPQIRVVHIQATDLNNLGTLTSPAVSALCHSKTLKELKLHPFDLTDDQFMTASRSLETNKALEELSLGICNFTVVTTAALAKMLRRNSILSQLELTPKQPIEDKLLIQIAEALEENTSLRHFSLHGNFGPISQPAKDAFERMLEENYMIESFRLYTPSDSIPEFRMYLRLNKVGRNHLLDPKSRVSRNDWLNAIHHVNDSLDCIFYCLSVNPFLCHTTKELQSQVRIARRGNKRRRLNNDDPDKMTSENSSSVNSSLSSSENSSSPAQSEERQTSTDSDNQAQNAAGGHQVTSTSESSNNNVKEERSSEEAASNRPAETSTSAAGSDSNEENNPNPAAAAHPAGPAPAPAPTLPAAFPQQGQQALTPQAFFEALFTGWMNAAQNLSQAQAAPTGTAPAQGVPPNAGELLASGLQALVSSSQQWQNMPAANQPQPFQQPPQQPQQQQPIQTTTDQQTQMQQQQHRPPQQADPPIAQQPQEQIQNLQVTSPQPAMQQQSQPQQSHHQAPPHQQQVVNATNASNSVFQLAFPILLSTLLRPGQVPQSQLNVMAQQLQQAFASANAFGVTPGQTPQQQTGALPLQPGPQMMGQVAPQQMQDSSQAQLPAQPQIPAQTHMPAQPQIPAQAQMPSQARIPAQPQIPAQAQMASQAPMPAQAPSSRASLPEAEIASSDGSAIPLYMPRDKDCLSSYQCFLRQQIELFEAAQEDVKSTVPGRNKPIRLGQVGLRCRHCATLPSRYRGTGATYYPAKLDRLYQAAQNMAQTHFTKHCRDIPQQIINELGVLLQGSKSSAGAGKKYWSDGAAMLGVYEDDDILRMDRSRASA